MVAEGSGGPAAQRDAERQQRPDSRGRSRSRCSRAETSIATKQAPTAVRASERAGAGAEQRDQGDDEQRRIDRKPIAPCSAATVIGSEWETVVRAGSIWS